MLRERGRERKRERDRIVVFENAAICGDCTVSVVDKHMSMEQ
jgi:hypothetical protein